MIQGNAKFVMKGYRDEEDLTHTNTLPPKYKKYNENISNDTFRSVKTIPKLIEVSSGALKAVFANYYINNEFKFDGIEQTEEFKKLTSFVPINVSEKVKISIIKKLTIFG